MANIKRIAEHSIDVDLLTGGVCIDVGCRGFQFSETLRDLGCVVSAFDIENMEAPPGIEFYNYAVLNKTGRIHYNDTKDQQAKHVCFDGQEGIPVLSLSLKEIYFEFFKGKTIDVLKCDAEGSEYLIFSDLNLEPAPRQITVEFHMHAHRQLHDQYFDKCMENLLKHYVAVKHELTSEHGAGYNYWDSLFVRRDLI